MEEWIPDRAGRNRAGDAARRTSGQGRRFETFEGWLRRRAIGVALFGCLASTARPAAGQTTDEPLFGQLVAAAHSPALNLGALLQVVADYQDRRSSPGTNGFTVANMRLSIGGELDGGFGYFLQGNLAATPVLLDAIVRYAPTERLGIEAGRFKVPFSQEYLTNAASIDFVNRSRVVDALAPARQVGVQVRGATVRGLSWAAGAFSGADVANPDGVLLGSARLSYATPPSDGGDERDTRVLAGVNLAYGGSGVIDGRPGPAGGEERRLLVGGDARVTSGRLLLSAEWIWARLTATGVPNREPWGYHATGGWSVTRRSQLLLRWDRLQGDEQAWRDQVVLGWNLWPTSPTEVQVNYVIPTTGTPSRHQLLVNLQVGF